jgi:hypothetical protein
LNGIRWRSMFEKYSLASFDVEVPNPEDVDTVDI